MAHGGSRLRPWTGGRRRVCGAAAHSPHQRRAKSPPLYGLRNCAPEGWATMDRLGLCGWLGRQCSTLGLQQPTPVQEACVPAAIQGKDVIGCAPTGSGKTAAFALPVLHLLSEDPFGIFALVLTPTR